MTNEKDKNGDLLPDEKRLSKHGKILRKTSIDEIPSFFNVLVGDMSVVGPRPLLERYLPRYNKYQKRRLEVKPGITGLAQINPEPSGKKSWKKSIKLDIYYVSNISFFLDMRILLRTLLLILFKKKQFEDFEKTYE